MQGFITNMVGNTNVPTVVKSGNKATYMEQNEINDLNEDLLFLHNELGDNINDANNKNNHDNTNLANTGLKSNKTLVPTSWKKRKNGFMDRLTRMLSGLFTNILLQKKMNHGAHTRLRVTTAF